MNLTFFASGLPKGQPRVKACRRGNHAGVYDPGTANTWKALVATAAKQAIGTHPRPMFDGPLKVDLTFIFPRPKHHHNSKGEIKPNSPTWHTAKPDRDNLEKAVSDILTQVGMWPDDAHVCAGQVSKRYAAKGEGSGCMIYISNLETNLPSPHDGQPQ